MPKINAKKDVKKHTKYNFKPVAMFFILVGSIFFTLGLLMIIFAKPTTMPAGFSYLITIGGALIITTGYTNLELGMIRKQSEK